MQQMTYNSPGLGARISPPTSDNPFRSWSIDERALQVIEHPSKILVSLKCHRIKQFRLIWIWCASINTHYWCDCLSYVASTKLFTENRFQFTDTHSMYCPLLHHRKRTFTRFFVLKGHKIVATLPLKFQISQQDNRLPLLY